VADNIIDRCLQFKVLSLEFSIMVHAMVLLLTLLASTTRHFGCPCNSSGARRIHASWTHSLSKCGLLFANVAATISHYVLNVPIKTMLWLRSNIIVQIAISLCLFQFANNNERFFPLIACCCLLLTAYCWLMYGTIFLWTHPMCTLYNIGIAYLSSNRMHDPISGTLAICKHNTGHLTLHHSSLT
jgi:hypothetical protein